MDLYGSLDPSLASGSGANTPIRETPDNTNQSSVGSSNADSAAGQSNASGSSASPAAASSKAKAPTLEQEIEQMGTLVSGMSKNLGSYWSSFRRQSEIAIKQSQVLASNAAKDLTPYLDKAKAELDKLNEQAKASAAAGQAASISELGVNPDNPSVVLKAPREDKGKGVDREGGNDDPTSPTGSVKTLVPESNDESKPIMNAAAFFSKLQHQLSSNPNFQNFQHTFQNMQHELKHKVDDFSKIDMHEAKEQYEKAMNSGEKYFKVASKELSDLFGEAVRIVPPEGYESPQGQGQATGAAGKAADKRRKDAAVAAAGRKEMLLHRIRSEPAILLVDPAEAPAAVGSSTSDASAEDKKETHADTREAFATFLQSVQEAGGLDNETWKERISSELADEDGGTVLRQTRDSVVPSKIPEEAFWTRYFFRKQQIEEDEARRREILEGAVQQEEEEFSWDMEDESVSSAAPEDYQEAENKEQISSESVATPKLGGPVKTAQAESSPAGSDEVDASWSSPAEPASPSISMGQAAEIASVELGAKGSSARNSSEEGTASSYDVVSAGDVSSPKAEKAPTKKGQDDDSDSDWE